MQTFKVNDKVFCPSITNQPLILHCQTFGVLHFYYNETCYRFNEQGHIINSTYFGDVVASSMPLLLHATEENRETLSHVYYEDFVLDVDVEVYAIRCHLSDSVYEWVVANETGGTSTCTMASKNTNLIQYLRNNNAIISTNKKLLLTIPQGHNFSIVCVGKDSINNWTNKVEL